MHYRDPNRKLITENLLQQPHIHLLILQFGVTLLPRRPHQSSDQTL